MSPASNCTSETTAAGWDKSLSSQLLLHACPCLVSRAYESLQFAFQVIRGELGDTKVRLTGRLRGTLHVVPEQGSLTLFQLAGHSRAFQSIVESLLRAGVHDELAVSINVLRCCTQERQQFAPLRSDGLWRHQTREHICQRSLPQLASRIRP